MSPLFHSHCSVSGNSSISSNSKTADSRTFKYKKSSIQWYFWHRKQKKAAMVNREPTTNQRENFDKFTAPNNNIIQCFFGQLGGLLPRSKERGTLDISREERSNKCFRIDGSKVCIFTFFLFASQSSINTHSYQ